MDKDHSKLVMAHGYGFVLHYYSNAWDHYSLKKKKKFFIEHRHIQYIRNDSKDIYDVTKYFFQITLNQFSHFIKKHFQLILRTVS